MNTLEQLTNLDAAIRELRKLSGKLCDGAHQPWLIVNHAITYLDKQYSAIYRSEDDVTRMVADALHQVEAVQ